MGADPAARSGRTGSPRSEVVGASVRCRCSAGRRGDEVAAVHAKVVRAEVAIARRDLWQRVAVGVARARARRCRGRDADRVVRADQGARADRAGPARCRHRRRGRRDVGEGGARARGRRGRGREAREPRARRGARGRFSRGTSRANATPRARSPGGDAELAKLRATLAGHPERAAALARLPKVRRRGIAWRCCIGRSLAIEASRVVQRSDERRTEPTRTAGSCSSFRCSGGSAIRSRAAERDRRGRSGPGSARSIASSRASSSRRISTGARRPSGRRARSRRDAGAAARGAAPPQASSGRRARSVDGAAGRARPRRRSPAELANARADAATAWADLQLAAGGEVGQ